MSDEMLAKLATRAGIATVWRDQASEERRVSVETLRAILCCVGFPAGEDGDVRNALSALDAGVHMLASKGGDRCPDDGDDQQHVAELGALRQLWRDKVTRPAPRTPRRNSLASVGFGIITEVLMDIGKFVLDASVGLKTMTQITC
jgi:hypothetical protein